MTDKKIKLTVNSGHNQKYNYVTDNIAPHYVMEQESKKNGELIKLKYREQKSRTAEPGTCSVRVTDYVNNLNSNLKVGISDNLP